MESFIPQKGKIALQKTQHRGSERPLCDILGVPSRFIAEGRFKQTLLLNDIITSTWRIGTDLIYAYREPGENEVWNFTLLHCLLPGNSDNKVDKLISAVELLTKQVSTLQSEITNIKGDGYKKSVSGDFNSGDRRDRNVILCKNCKDNNRTTRNHCFICGSSNHLARGCRKPSSDSQGSWKRLVVLGNQQSRVLCPKRVIIVKKYYLRNIIVVVVANMFIFLGKDTSLGPGHTTNIASYLTWST